MNVKDNIGDNKLINLSLYIIFKEWKKNHWKKMEDILFLPICYKEMYFNLHQIKRIKNL